MAHLDRGMALHAMTRFEEALSSYDRAIALDPKLSLAHYNRANALKAMRRFAEALESYDCAIALSPDDPFCWNNRGNLLRELGRVAEALECYDHAIASKPDLFQAHYNRGEALHRTGHVAEAFASFDRALALNPGFAEAWYKRGNAVGDLQRLDEALRNYERAIALKADFAEAWNHRGNVLRRLARLDEALQSYTRAIACRSNYALAFNNRSLAFGALGRFDRALTDCDRAIELDPGLAEAHYNRGNLLKSTRRLAEAIEEFDRAIALKPDFADAHWNKGVTALLNGDFEKGWPLYEWRSNKAGQANAAPQPNWTGQVIGGKTLLIVAEQGFGDTLQFSRFAGIVAARGANVVFAVQDRLRRLLDGFHPDVRIIRVSDPYPAFDYSVRLLSIPLVLGTTLNSIPARVPYLRAEPDRIGKWANKLGSNGFRVGISWQGATGGEVDIGRSFDVRAFELLARIPDVRLISLQKNAGSEQLRELPTGMNVESFGDALDEGADAFVDTAALMESLDLIISSDTGVAHLAGALGRPVWVALSFVPDWRWLLDRSDSPWYPTMKLFRQTRRGDWSSVFEQMESELRQLAGRG